jgi:predicted DNA-binding antitoxin AbrB/MazE fold protein
MLSLGARVMAITAAAIYENGVLKPVQPLPLKERAQVQLTVHRPGSLADQTFGMIGWVGDADTFDRLLQESEAERLEHA